MEGIYAVSRYLYEPNNNDSQFIMNWDDTDSEDSQFEDFSSCEEFPQVKMVNGVKYTGNWKGN